MSPSNGHIVNIQLYKIKRHINAAMHGPYSVQSKTPLKRIRILCIKIKKQPVRRSYLKHKIVQNKTSQMPV